MNKLGRLPVRIRLACISQDQAAGGHVMNATIVESITVSYESTRLLLTLNRREIERQREIIVGRRISKEVQPD